MRVKTGSPVKDGCRNSLSKRWQLELPGGSGEKRRGWIQDIDCSLLPGLADALHVGGGERENRGWHIGFWHSSWVDGNAIYWNGFTEQVYKGEIQNIILVIIYEAKSITSPLATERIVCFVLLGPSLYHNIHLVYSYLLVSLPSPTPLTLTCDQAQTTVFIQFGARVQHSACHMANVKWLCCIRLSYIK